MKNKVTPMELETLEFRKDHLRAKVKQLEALLSGRSGSILPLVRGGDGRWSEEQGRAFIRELLEALELACYSDCEEEPSLTEGMRKAFESFLYCALRALEAPMPTRRWAAPLGGDWEGLLSLAGQTQFRDKYALYFGEAYGGLEVSCFFSLMNEMYAAFTGERAVDQVPSQELAAMEERFRDEIAECKADDAIHQQWAEALEHGEVDDPFAEPLGTDTPFVARPDKEFLAEEQKEEEAVEAWKENFPEKEAFCRAYLLFRQRFFEENAWQCLRSRIEQMADICLYRQGVSSFLTDDAFFLARELLGRTEKQLRNKRRFT